MTRRAPSPTRAARDVRIALVGAVLIAVLGACSRPADASLGGRPAHAAGADSLPHALSPDRARITDEVIARDLGAIDGWRARLDTLPGAAGDPWRAAAARDWLTLARAEYTDRDAQGVADAAFGKAVALVGEIQSGAPPMTYETVPAAAVITGSTRVRADLWQRLDSLKHDPQFLCAAAEIARLEVELAWAGNEQLDQGDCKSSPHVAMAVASADEAARKEAACRPIPLPPPPPPPPMPTAVELEIPRNVHFALDQATISRGSRSVIEGIAAILRKYPSISVRLEGHTDSRASVDYNLALSRRRVLATRSVFLDLGIDSSRLSIDYKGKGDLIATEDSKRGFALNRRVEMVFVDYAGLDIKSTRQEGDLQIEADRAARKSHAAAPGKPSTPKPPATPGKPKAPATKHAKPAAAPSTKDTSKASTATSK